MSEPDRERAFPGLWLSLGLVVAVVVAEGLAGVLLPRLGVQLPDAAANLFLATVVGNGVVIGLFMMWRKLDLRDVLHPSASSPAAVAGMSFLPVLLVSPAVFLLGCLLDDAVVAVFPLPDWFRLLFEELLAGGVSTILAMVIVAPLVEEVLFRGIVLRGLLARMGEGRAIVISSLIFGAAHFNVYQFIGAGLLGLPLGWLYVRFRSTLPGMLLHALGNLLVVLQVSSSGIDSKATDIPIVFWIAGALMFWPGIRMVRSLARASASRPEAAVTERD